MRRAAPIAPTIALGALALVAAGSACNALTGISDYDEVDCTGPCAEADTGLDGPLDGLPPVDGRDDTAPTGDTAGDTRVDGADTGGDTRAGDALDTGPTETLADADAPGETIDPSPYDPCIGSAHILCTDFEPTDAVAQFKMCTDTGITPGTVLIDATGDEYASAVSSLSASTFPDTADFEEACFVGHVTFATAHRFDLDLAVYVDEGSPTAATGHASIATLAFDTALVTLDMSNTGYWAVTTKYAATPASTNISPKLVETRRWHEMHLSVDWNATPYEVDLTVDHVVVGTFLVGLGAYPSTLDVRVGLVTSPPWDQPTKVHIDNVYLDDSP